VDYKEGSIVKKGELLSEVDPRLFEGSLDVAKAIHAKYEVYGRGLTDCTVHLRLCRCESMI